MVQDAAFAAVWYAKAAAQGDAAAQYNLGFCYEHGTGVARDASLALSWYRKARAQGDEDATAAVARLTGASRRTS